MVKVRGVRGGVAQSCVWSSPVYTDTNLLSFNPTIDRTNDHERILVKGSFTPAAISIPNSSTIAKAVRIDLTPTSPVAWARKLLLTRNGRAARVQTSLMNRCAMVVEPERSR